MSVFDSRQKSCPIEGCSRSLPPGLLMCGFHWRQVPRDLRAELALAEPGSARRIEARQACLTAIENLTLGRRGTIA